MASLEYLSKKFHLNNKLYIDATLEALHSTYKNCIANTITTHMNNQTLPDYEICLDEKRKYYAYLNDVKRIEHDNLFRFFNMKVLNQEHPVSK